MWWVAIIISIILVAACVVSYHYGEIHELHIVRAEFDRAINLQKQLKQHPDLSGLECAEDIVNDLLEELEEWM